MEMVGPLPYVLGALAHHAFTIVPIHVIEKFGKDWTLPANMVCNGAFILQDWKPQQNLTCIPNPKYWDKDKVRLAKVIFYPSDDLNTVHKMYLNGELDWANTVPLDQIEAVQSRPDFQTAPSLITYYYIFNQKKPPFGDVKVRKALSMAVNRKDLTKKITKAGQIPTAAIVPPMPGYPKVAGNMDNIELAKKLLAEAGFPGGKGFPKFELLYNSSESHKKIAEYVQQQWKENLGIECTLANQEWKTYLANRNAGQFEVVRAGWAGDYLDPNTFLELFKSLATTTGLPQWACGGCLNAEYDKLVDQAGTEMNAKKRMALMAKAEEILVTKDQAIAPFYHYVTLNMIDTKKWGGWYTNTLDVHPMKDVFLK
jgi:oligopeptide transport system substrate-binding protein